MISVRASLSRLIVCSVVACLLSALPGPGPSARARAAAPIGAQPAPPDVDAAAFRGQGHLAFVWAGTLYVLDGTRVTLRRITPLGSASKFLWSPDGRWLAYDTGDGQLWLTRADGTSTHRVTGLPGPVASYTWLAAADVLVIGLVGTSPTPGLWTTTPSGQAHKVASAPAFSLPSPDGRALAYTVTLPFGHHPETRSDALYTVATAGGRPVPQYLGRQEGVWLIRWWPDSRGLLFWKDPFHSESGAADGLGLYTLPLGGSPRLITTALTGGLAVSPSGRTLLIMSGLGRELWHDKALTLCAIETALCHALPRPPGFVLLDPAWSPRGDRIAYVRAHDRGSAVGAFGFTTNRALLAWVRTHTLWVADARGRQAREVVAAGTGIYRPQWSGDDRHVLYIRNNSLWLIDTGGGAPTRVVGPFPGAPDLFGFYGSPYLPLTYAWNRR